MSFGAASGAFGPVVGSLGARSGSLGASWLRWAIFAHFRHLPWATVRLNRRPGPS